MTKVDAKEQGIGGVLRKQTEVKCIVLYSCANLL
jgi:hypothetical protein